MYQNLLKEGSGDHKYLSCQDLQELFFEVLRSEIELDKVDLVCAETVKPKPTGSNSSFITYAITSYFSGVWLYKIGYLITQ